MAAAKKAAAKKSTKKRKAAKKATKKKATKNSGSREFLAVNRALENWRRKPLKQTKGHPLGLFLFAESMLVSRWAAPAVTCHRSPRSTPFHPRHPLAPGVPMIDNDP